MTSATDQSNAIKYKATLKPEWAACITERFADHPKTSRIKTLDRPANDHEIKAIRIAIATNFIDGVIIDSPHKDSIIANAHHINPQTWKEKNTRDPFGYINQYTKQTSQAAISTLFNVCANDEADKTHLDIATRLTLDEAKHQEKFILPLAETFNTYATHYFLMHTLPGIGQQGARPEWHVDSRFRLAAYTNLYNDPSQRSSALQCLPAERDTEQYIGLDEDELNAALENESFTIDAGQTFIFAPQRVCHRSSRNLDTVPQMCSMLFVREPQIG